MQDVSIPAMIRRQVAQAGGSTILRKKDRGIWKAVAWAELGRRVDAVAAGLQAAGIGRGDVVGVLSDISPAFIAADLGILAAGSVALALYPSDAGDAVAHVLAGSGCQLLFVEGEEQLDKVLHARAQCPALRRIVILDMKGLRAFTDPMCESFEVFLARGTGFVMPDIGADHPAVLAYTAGTTGPARPIRLSHRNVITQIGAGLALTGLGPADERLAFLPMAQVTERIFGLYLSLAAGAISNLVESVETVPENLAEVRPTVLIAPPRVWQRLAGGLDASAAAATNVQRGLFRWAMRAGSGLARRLVLRPALAAVGLDRLRCAWVGGAAVSPDIIRRFHTLGVPLVEFYGLTECGGLASLDAPVAGLELRIAADGEIHLRGPQVADENLADGWLATGDLGHHVDGGLRFEGRANERLILPDGSAVLPSMLENALKLSPFIGDALVVGEGQGRLGCLVMLEPDVLEGWALARDLPPGNFAALVQSDEVRALVQTEIDRVNGTARVALGCFAVIDRRLEPGDPELTAMMRLRRDVVLAGYADRIETMFRSG